MSSEEVKEKETRIQATPGQRRFVQNWIRNNEHREGTGGHGAGSLAGPYPTKVEKEEIAAEIKMTVKQVENLFFNSRKRQHKELMAYHSAHPKKTAASNAQSHVPPMQNSSGSIQKKQGGASRRGEVRQGASQSR